LKVGGAESSIDMIDTENEQKKQLGNTKSYQLNSYLKQDKRIAPQSAIGDYLGIATFDVSAKDELNTKLKTASDKGDKQEVGAILDRDLDNNKRISKRFDYAVNNADINNADQMEILRSSEVNRVSNMAVPLGNKQDMETFKGKNQAFLVGEAIKYNVLGSISPNKNSRNLYTSLETAYGNKLSSIGVSNPYDVVKQTQDQFLQTGQPERDKLFNTMDFSLQNKLKSAGITNMDQLGSMDSKEVGKKLRASGSSM